MSNLTPHMSASHERLYFEAMNTGIEVKLGFDGQGAAEEQQDAYEAVRNWFTYVERKFSRFKPESELSQLNQRAGSLAFLSDTMLEVLQLAREFTKATGGAFHPLLLSAMQAAGYERSFETLSREGLGLGLGLDLGLDLSSDTVPLEAWKLDAGMKAVLLPKGAGLDLGGLVKGWAAERMSGWLQQKWQVPRGLINAGGDVVVWDRRREPLPWQIGVANPWHPGEDLKVVAMTNGAIATSSTVGRTWLTSEGSMHHLIDPRTMRPSRSDVVQCTVIGPSLPEAEVWAKAICILGMEEGVSLLQKQASSYEAIVCTADQQVHDYPRGES